MAESSSQVSKWAAGNSLSGRIIGVLSENGIESIDDLRNLGIYGVEELTDLKLGEINRLRTALQRFDQVVESDTPDASTHIEKTEQRKSVPAVPQRTPQQTTTKFEPKTYTVQDMLDNSDKFDDEGDLTHYKIRITELGRSSTALVRRCQYGQEPEISKQRSILVIGETGSGKSTMIDSIINYICNVTTDDKHRFHIIDNLDEDLKGKGKADSLTDWITCYTFHPPVGASVDFTVNIIDTPGFGDTRGMKRDQEIIVQIKELFQSRADYGLDSLHAVCFVMKASVNRLTINTKYILDAVMMLFANDLKDNIFIMCSHSDDPDSKQAEEALKTFDVPYKSAYRFNNKWMQHTNNLTKLFSSAFKKNMFAFFENMSTIIPKSLYLSTEVLSDRKELEDCADALHRLISSTTGKLDEIIKKKKAMKSNQHSREGVEVAIMERIQTAEMHLNCSKCEATCRMFVAIFVAKITKQQKCDICDCTIKDHEFKNYRYDWKRTINVRPTRDVNLTSRERELVDAFQRQLQKMRVKIDRLKEIALRPDSRSTEEYIDFSIERETIEAKCGWQDRVMMLHTLKDHYQIISNPKHTDKELFELLSP